MRLPVQTDERSERQRAEALSRARDQASAHERRQAIVAHLEVALRLAQDHAAHPAATQPDLDPGFWDALDAAYVALDDYLDHLIDVAQLQLSCSAGCSACCSAAPSVVSLEGLRMVRALQRMPDGHLRAQRAVEQARKFQAVLQRVEGETSQVSSGSTGYKQAQLAWRSLLQPCPVLGDDGRCSAYAARPIACRAYVAVEDPAQCEPRSPRFLQAEHPRIWSDLREAEVEQLLAKIGDVLELPSCPNLQWAIARTHDHPLGRPT